MPSALQLMAMYNGRPLVGKTQNANHMPLITSYLGHPSKPQKSTIIHPSSPVCCQPTALIPLYVANLQPSSPVCCQPTAILSLYVANLQHSYLCMLPTYSPPALYVANLQRSCPCMLPTYSPPSPVCCQPSDPSPVCCRPTALLALYVANLQHS